MPITSRFLLRICNLRWFSLFIFCAPLPLYANCANPPLPNGVTPQYVGKNIQVNGLSLDIIRYTSEIDNDQLHKFYERVWNNDSNLDNDHFSEYNLNTWQVIAYKTVGCLFTVQMKKLTSGKTETLIALNSGSKIQKTNPDFPMMSGSKVISDMSSNDSGRLSRLLVFTNSYSPKGNLSYYQNKLSALGWGQVLKPKNLNDNIAASFRKESKWVDLTITNSNGQTQLVANITN